MNHSIFKNIADNLINCIRNGDKDLWQQLLMIEDDVALQSMLKWFEDYFVIHQVKHCEILLLNTCEYAKDLEFVCQVKAEYREYDDFIADLLVKLNFDNTVQKFKIMWMERIYLQDDKNDFSFQVDAQTDAVWWESPLVKEAANQNSSLPHNHLARAITRNIRFREAHIKLECASLLTCMMSQAIPGICRKMNLPNTNSEEKIKTLYHFLRNKFNLQITRPDRDSTWASKYLAPWYGLEEILAGHADSEKIPVSCNAFMTTLYSLLRWSGFLTSQVVQFRIINQDYLIIRSDDQTFYFISHDIFTPCNKRTIYPSGKINRVFGAEWYIDFKNNYAEASPELILEYNLIARNTFLPEYLLTGRESGLPPMDLYLSCSDLRQKIFKASNTYGDSIYLWVKYANQTLFVSKPETYIYWSVRSNWGAVSFSNEAEIYHYMGQLKERSIFPEADRIMTADQCIRHQMGGTKDIAVFLYAALKKFLNVEGCVVFTRNYEYCIYRYQGHPEWIIYNVCQERQERSLEGEIFLAFNEVDSYYPLIDPNHTKLTWYNKLIGNQLELTLSLEDFENE